MTNIRIVISNTSDAEGTFLTPFWLGFSDASFSLFGVGETAGRGIEAIAEDGVVSFAAAELLAADADGQGFVIAGAQGPIAPGETIERTVSIDGDSNPLVSLASMLLPSNDAFVGVDQLAVFDSEGGFLGEQTLVFAGTDVLDAGTEVNTELDAAFINQTAPNTGVDEGGVIAAHPGFNGSLGNPVGEGDQIILGGTNAFGGFIDPVAADFTRPGAQIATVHINTVVERTGSDARDVIVGRGDDDLVDAGQGNDSVFGQAGWDVIDGGGGNDFLAGGDGNDVIAGGEGNDVVRGEAGDDILSGGSGTDWLNGGEGADLFRFAQGDDRDDIFGFESGTDRLAIDIEGIDDFDALLAVAQQFGGNVSFDFGGGDRLVLRDFELATLSAADVIFG